MAVITQSTPSPRSYPPPSLTLNPDANPFRPSSSWKDTCFPSTAASSRGLSFFEPRVEAGQIIASCSRSEISKGASFWADALFGTIVGLRPHVPTLKRLLLSKWQVKGSFEISFHANFLVFRFSDLSEKQRVLETGPWFVSGHLLILRPWKRKIETLKEELNAIPIWIQIPDLPLEFWTRDSISKIGSTIGIPLFADEHTVNRTRTSFARICVEVSPFNTLPDDIWIDIEGVDGFKQKITYEWRPKICSHCKSFFHSEAKCKFLLDAKGEENGKAATKKVDNPLQNKSSKQEWVVVGKKKKGLARIQATSGISVGATDDRRGLGSNQLAASKERQVGGLGSPANARPDEMEITATCILNQPDSAVDQPQISSGLTDIASGVMATGVSFAQHVSSDAAPVVVGDFSVQHVSSDAATFNFLQAPLQISRNVADSTSSVSPALSHFTVAETSPFFEPSGPSDDRDSLEPLHCQPKAQGSTPTLDLPSSNFQTSFQSNRNHLPSDSCTNPCPDSTKHTVNPIQPVSPSISTLSPQTPTFIQPLPATLPDSSLTLTSPDLATDVSFDVNDSTFPPGFTPTKDDLLSLRGLMKEGVELVPPEHRKDFLLSVDLAKDEEILEFFQQKFKEKVNVDGDTNYLTCRNVRCSPRIRKKPARLTDSPSSSGLKRGFFK